MLFEIPSAEMRERFADRVRSSFPGGEHIADHVNDGPWYVLVVRSAENPNWLLEDALARYPKATLPYAEWWGRSADLNKADVYVVPKFVDSLAYHYVEEYRFETYEAPSTTFASFPTAQELDPVLVDLLCPPAEEEEENKPLDPNAGLRVTRREFRTALTDLVARVGAKKVAERAVQYADDQDFEELVEFVMGWQAAVAVPTAH